MKHVKRRYGVLAAAVVPMAVIAATASWAQTDEPLNGFSDKAGGSVECDPDEGVIHWTGEFSPEKLTADSPAEAIAEAASIATGPLATNLTSQEPAAVSVRRAGSEWVPEVDVDFDDRDGGSESLDAVGVLFESGEGDVAIQATISRVGDAWVLEEFFGCESAVAGSRSAARLLADADTNSEDD